MIALVPHIVRTPDYTAENLRGIYAGTDQVVKINYAPKADEEAAPGTPGTVPAAPAAPRQGAAVQGTPAPVQGLTSVSPQTNSTVVIQVPVSPAPLLPPQLIPAQPAAPKSAPAAENASPHPNGPVNGASLPPPPARKEAPDESKESVSDALMSPAAVSPGVSKESVSDALMSPGAVNPGVTSSGAPPEIPETAPDQVARVKR